MSHLICFYLGIGSAYAASEFRRAGVVKEMRVVDAAFVFFALAALWPLMSYLDKEKP